MDAKKIYHEETLEVILQALKEEYDKELEAV